jgi:hypothetical protein
MFSVSNQYEFCLLTKGGPATYFSAKLAVSHNCPRIRKKNFEEWFRQCRTVAAQFLKMRKAGLSSGLRGDKVYTPSPRRSEGQCDQLWGALSEPHCEQNPYANPKRTAKSSRS